MKHIVLRQNIRAVLIVWLLFSVNIVSAALPTWVSNLPLWQWYAIPNTALSSVEPSPRPCGNTGPASKIEAWNGATLKREGSVYLIGAAGGHGDYCGNEVDALKLNTITPQWVQLSPPSANSAVINTSQFYLDLKPSATHTYYATQFVNARNRLFVLPSQGMLLYGLPNAPIEWPYFGGRGYSFSFNMATNSWDAPDYVGYYPGGGAYQAALAAKHPVTEDIYYNRDGGGWWKWTQATNSWSQLSSTNMGNFAGAAIDPIRNRMLLIGSYNNDKDPRVANLNGTQIPVDFGGLGPAALRLGNYPGVVYDEANDKFLVFANDGTNIQVYRVDAATWSVDSPSISGTLPSARKNGIQNSVQYVPELGGVVIANDYYGNVLFMRTSSAGAPVPTAPPPTSGDTQAPTVPTNLSASVLSSSQINLVWSASSDNVGVSGYRVYRGGTQITTVSGTSYQDAGLSAGTAYTYVVAANDVAGNVSGQSAPISAATPSAPPPSSSDTQAPTTPAKLSASALSSSQIALAWSASSDKVGVTAYRVFRGGSQVATVSGVSYQDSGLSAGTAYTYTVAAYDAAGNVSGQSAPISATTQTVATAPPPSGNQITSFQLTSTVGGTSLPFTIGLGFKKGDIADTPALNIPASQVIVKSRWNDGSVKMAIASGEVTLAAGTPSTITVSSSSASSGTTLTPADIKAATPQASVSLGSYGTVNLSSLLATPFRTWISGPEMVEAHYRSNVGSDPTLAVWFHVRLYKSGRMWVRAIVENGYVNVTTADKSYVPTVAIGGTTIFNNSGVTLTHYAHTRWMQEGWIGGNPRITPKHDSAYLISTKLVPNYWKRNPSATALNALTQSYTPMNKADLTADMSNTGYQKQIGLLPLWDALYVTSGDARAYNSCLTNSSSYNSYAIVWRDPNTNLIPKPTDWPTYVANVSHWAGGLQWEMAHAPSEGYLAYLITGDYWHYETMQMNSAINYLTRNNNTGNGVNRVLLSQTRGNAWNLRTLTQAVAVAYEGDTVAADYKTLLTNNITHWKTVADSLSGSQLGYPSDYEVATSSYSAGAGAPWQHHFWIQTMGMGSDLEPLPDMTVFNAVRDFLYKGIVGILGDASGYYFTSAYAYNLKISPIANTWDPVDFYTSWKTVFDTSVAAGLISNDTTGNTLLGGSGGAPSAAATGYWGNLLPAIAYAVDHNATGAAASWSRLTSATNWSTVESSGFDNTPIWGIVPRSFTSPPPPSGTVPPSAPTNLRLQ